VKAFFLAIAIVGAVLGTAPRAADAATGESRVALVIGNSRYPDAPLRNASNDARAMAASLRERGFDVILRENATKPQMESAIIDFGEKLSEGATGLFFFAGHGMQVQGRNFIVPTDAKLTTEQRVKLEAVDIETVLDQMQGARSKVNVVILDACRNNPFERRFRSASGGLAQINAPEGTLIAYATAPGRVAADGEGANGLYTSELLKALRTPGLKVEDVFKQVRINVARASNGAQTPWEASSLIGDFYFVAPPPPTAANTPPSNAAEVAFWNAIQSSSDPAEFKAYAARYPQGEFIEIARLRLDALERARLASQQVAVVAPRPEPPAANARLRGLDGKYQALIAGASWTTGDVAAVIEIKGSVITGSATRGDQPRPCRVTGRISDDGTLATPMRLECDAIADRETRHESLQITLEGRFASAADGEIVGVTTFRSSDRRTGQASWRRFSDAPPQLQNAAVGTNPTPVAVPPKPVQQAALPPASAPIPADRRYPADGIYNAKFTMIGQQGFLNFEAAIEIANGQILGKSTTSNSAPDSCTLSGNLDPATGDVISMFMACRWITAHFKGRFNANPQSGIVEGQTEARSIMDGRVIPVVWRR